MCRNVMVMFKGLGTKLFPFREQEGCAIMYAVLKSCMLSYEWFINYVIIMILFPETAIQYREAAVKQGIYRFI